MACSCPKPTALTTITASTCPFNINQIQRIYVVREGQVIFDISTPANNVPATITGTAPEDITAWTTLKTAADSTKIVYPPLFGGDPVVESGGQITFGGNDNSTLNGKTKHVGYEPSTFSARYDSLEPQVEADIDALVCEGDGMEVFFVLQDGTILGRYSDAPTNNLFTGIPTETAIALLGRNVVGFTQDDNNSLTFQLAKTWSQTIVKITPTFNALTGI